MEQNSVILLAKDVYEACIEKLKNRLIEQIDDIFSSDATKGFSHPQGPTFGKISSLCIMALEAYMNEVWKTFLEILAKDSHEVNPVSLKTIIEAELSSQSEYLVSLMNTYVISRFNENMQPLQREDFSNQLDRERHRLKKLYTAKTDLLAGNRRRQRITERAFIHLQRSIVVDPSTGLRWQEAYHSGEVNCEKLGGIHLLLHGIWGFKASGTGERTDLVLGQPLIDLSEVEASADALVLTEWKVVRSRNKTETKAKQAYQQASAYVVGVFGGLELAEFRYLVLVSEDVLDRLPDLHEGSVTYRHINIAVSPKTPSKR